MQPNFATMYLEMLARIDISDDIVLFVLDMQELLAALNALRLLFRRQNLFIVQFNEEEAESSVLSHPVINYHANDDSSHVLITF
ncbi:unnamed protein product [Onchocerca flexuosa]|uniref:Uncharacterized protein n=1 Tax=Onchocerca flexuosa TaxID=387005 RepID=A0A183H8E8_9BILA|nr:unnamed protein product [Onchocerca flexuosa]